MVRSCEDGAGGRSEGQGGWSQAGTNPSPGLGRQGKWPCGHDGPPGHAVLAQEPGQACQAQELEPAAQVQEPEKAAQAQKPEQAARRGLTVPFALPPAEKTPATAVPSSGLGPTEATVEYKEKKRIFGIDTKQMVEIDRKTKKRRPIRFGVPILLEDETLHPPRHMLAVPQGVGPSRRRSIQPAWQKNAIDDKKLLLLIRIVPLYLLSGHGTHCLHNVLQICQHRGVPDMRIPFEQLLGLANVV